MQQYLTELEHPERSDPITKRGCRSLCTRSHYCFPQGYFPHQPSCSQQYEWPPQIHRLLYPFSTSLSISDIPDVLVTRSPENKWHLLYLKFLCSVLSPCTGLLQMQQTSTPCFSLCCLLTGILSFHLTQRKPSSCQTFSAICRKKSPPFIILFSLSVCVERVRTFVQAAILTSNVLFLNIYRHEGFAEI